MMNWSGGQWTSPDGRWLYAGGVWYKDGTSGHGDLAGQMQMQALAFGSQQNYEDQMLSLTAARLGVSAMSLAAPGRDSSSAYYVPPPPAAVDDASNLRTTLASTDGGQTEANYFKGASYIPPSSGGGQTMMVPVAGSKLPAVIKLLRVLIAGGVARGGGLSAATGGMLGGGFRGSFLQKALNVLGVVSVYEAIDGFLPGLGSDESKDVEGFVKLMMEGIEGGSIWVPEAPMGMPAELYMEQLNHLHINLASRGFRIGDLTDTRYGKFRGGYNS